mgnify:CR=1 FL=1
MPLVRPHLGPQVDTMGVALRYFNRWTIEDGTAGFLLPAVLNSGDTLGIMTMEFPLINILTAFGFGMGVECGRVFAFVILYLIVLVLYFCNILVWNNKIIAGIPAQNAILLLLFFL